MKRLCGLVVGAGTSAQYIGLGFIPDEVTLKTVDQANEYMLFWNRQMLRASTHPEGQSLSGADLDSDITKLTDGNGIEPYYGGDVVSAASANQVVSIYHPALESTYGKDQRTGGTGTITTWTSDTTVQGHFDYGVDTTYVGVGSKVIATMKNGPPGPVREYALVALTNDGDAANEADLQNNPGGVLNVIRITYMYDFANLTAGYTMPVGIKINETSLFNASGTKFYIDAIKW